jgi:hypothetical protein
MEVGRTIAQEAQPAPPRHSSDTRGDGAAIEVLAPGARRRRYQLRQALVRLAASAGDASEALALEAGRAAVELAESGDGEGLRLILRSDPEAPPIAWTVACYEIGHLTPSALQDLSDPCEAVNLVAACHDAGHVASELVVSTGGGAQWNALIRTGAAVRLKLPQLSEDGAAPRAPGTLDAAAHRRWQEILECWSVEPEPIEIVEPAPQEGADVASAVARVVAALDAIDHRLSHIEDLIRAGHPVLTSSSPP